MYKLKLYITIRETRKSIELLNNIMLVFEKELAEPYTLEVIDILDHPQKAIDDEIFATPTLVRVEPLPVKKIMGDLSDRKVVWEKLGLIKGEEAIEP